MAPERCHIICFSPTGTTRALARETARGTGLPSLLTDCTLPAARARQISPATDALVILAAPVYFGRLQQTAAGIFSSLAGMGLPTVLLVNYGNRHYDDALVELDDLARQRGFLPVAAGAFCSEHSFSTPECPMAAGRPDAADLEKARDFGTAIMGCLTKGRTRPGALPGNRPYRDYPVLQRPPLNVGACTLCGLCEENCPTGAISLGSNEPVTRADLCIICQACVRLCPEKARADTGPGAAETRARLAPLVRNRREPEIFLPS